MMASPPSQLRPDSLELADRAGEWRSAYVHIPFCARVCPYCDFAVVEGQENLIDRYVAALRAEVSMADDWDTLDAVFIGGGTPSQVSPTLIGSILEALDARFGLVDGVEVSMEANPEDITAQSSAGYRAAGVNRLSLGVQSFDDVVLTALGRQHTGRQALKAIEDARSDFERLSIDLIYGDPTETEASWDRTLDLALAAGTDHVSAYSLTVELGTPLSRAVAAGAPAPDDDVQADRWERAAERLSTRLIRYEVSNYATAAPCKYNLATWAQGEYVAFGLGAHGHRNGIRTRNLRRLDRYMEAIEAGQSPIAGQTVGSDWDRELERLMLGLRRTAGVVAGVGGQQLLERHPEFVNAGIIEHRDGRIVVVKPLLTDTVIREVLAVPPQE